MSRSALTGTRIRERRLALKRPQTEIARAAGISAAYLNLIEYNRRRVGAELLARIALALGVPASALDEDSESGIVIALREAAAAHADSAPTPADPAGDPVVLPEADRIEEFVSRFPGWAASLAERQLRVGALERRVEALSERLTHDPFLSSALHEVLSVVTSIRSTAAILAEGDAIPADVQTRFHRNIHDDSLRLSGVAGDLARYLDRAEEDAPLPVLPMDEAMAWIERQGWHLPALEGSAAIRPEDLVEASDLHGPGRDLALGYARQAARDALQMPLEAFIAVARDEGQDPGRIAARADLPMAAVMRRLAALPEAPGLQPTGLAVCDGAGVLVFRKPLPGFALPRLGGACPLWPLYQALTEPGRPIRRVVEIAAREPRRFLTDAYCELRHPSGAEGPQLAQAYMLFRPLVPGGSAAAVSPVPAGIACRICSRSPCAARREPSVLGAVAARGAAGAA